MTSLWYQQTIHFYAEIFVQQMRD
uniref:Uncharacterized protein n=1 Tax=Rhizophora mucronata TaxID=61149 RepID=A0A2P2Q453_RHIMU